MKLRLTISIAMLICLWSTSVLAMKVQVKLNQQGVLQDDTGAPYNGSATINCRIYDALDAGNLIHTEPATVQNISDGLFNLTMGDGALPMSPDVFASDADSGDVVRYLEMEINGEVLPRIPLVSTPFAVAAHRLAGDVETMPGQLRIDGAQPATPIAPMVDIKMNSSNGSIMGGWEYPPDPIKPQFNMDFDDVAASLNIQGLISAGAGLAPSVRVGADPVKGANLQMDADNGSGIAPRIKVAADPEISSSMSLEFNQTAGINPCARIAADGTMGSFLQLDGDSAGGINPCVKVAADVVSGSLMQLDINQASGIIPCVRVGADPTAGSFMQLDVNQSSGIIPCVRVGADPMTGSFMQMDVGQFSGIVPCVRTGVDLSGASMTLARTFAAVPSPVRKVGYPGLANLNAANDSLSITMSVDSNVAEISMFAGTAADVPSLVMMADGSEARVGINTNGPTAALDVVGDICVSGSIGACSDIRYKNDVHLIEGALEKIDQIRGVNYSWRSQEFENMRFPEGRQIGVIAQDVESVLPELVSTREDTYKVVDYAKLTAVLVEAVKELKAQNEAMRMRLEQLEGERVGAVVR